jgi:hypothetical protein
VKAIHGACDVTEHVLNRLFAIDVKQYSAAAVEVEERLRLSFEYFEPVGDRDLVVVRTPLSVPAGSKPLEQFVMTASEIDNGLKLNVFELLRHRVRHLCLS